MPARRLAAVWLACLLLPALPARGAEPRPAARWAAASRPAIAPPRVVGAHGLGCIAGAVALPPEGPGWEVLRLSRNRFWGHPALIATLRGLAGAARQAGLPPLWIGDLGQPRGGPMPWGHASHQIGLDADVWLDVTPRGAMPPAVRDRITVASLVRPDGQGIDPARWSGRHASLIRLAAQQPGVDRVFVNPAIKQALCASHAGAPWLRQVRPWAGLDSHMHVRLRCPPGQAECRDQAPIPAGDGCDASLDWWFMPRPPTPPPAVAPPPPALPAACAAILTAP